MIRATYQDGIIGVSASGKILGDDTLRQDFELKINSYTHKRLANGGFWDAQISVSGDALELFGRSRRILGMDVRTVSASGDEVWNGFINEIGFDFGSSTFSVGPLMDVRNNLSVVYQTTRYNTNPPIGGQSRRLPPLLDQDSATRYGIIGYELSGGTGSTDDAISLRQRNINEYKEPRSSRNARVGGSSRASSSITISCLGYVHLLDKFIYTLNLPGFYTPQEKILSVLQAEPNGIFSTLYSPDENTLTVPVAEQGSTGWAVIKSVVSLGDTAFDRYIFNIGKDRLATYSKIPTVYKYALEADGKIYSSGNHVLPVNIEPGHWLNVAYISAGGSSDETIGENASDIFIESVSYTAPDTAAIEGGVVDRSVQQLSQRGVGGSF